MFAELNKVIGNITFTAEQKVNKQMLLLDCLSSRTNEKQLKTCVY